MGLARLVLTSGVLLAAFYAYNPLPPGVEQPLGYMKRLATLRLIEDISYAAELLGIHDMRIVRRDLIEWYNSSPIRPTKNPGGLQVTKTTFGGVEVVVYTPPPHNQDGGLRKGLFHTHGGGYVTGSTQLCHPVLSKIAMETGAVIVSVDYRLAPEHPSPAPLEDCFAASKYFFENAKAWGVDPKRIGVFGPSAGGNMAAVLSLKYRDEGGDHQFAYQILIYPWMQAMDFRLPSYLEQDKYMPPDMRQKGMVIYTLSFIGIDRKHIPTFQKNQHVTKETRLKYSKYFKLESLPGYEALGKDEEPEVDEDLARVVEPLITNPLNFPLMAETLDNLPPALVMTCGVDTIRDDGILYLGRLREAGVETEHYYDDLCWHAAFAGGAGDNPPPSGARLVDGAVRYIKKQV